MSPDREGRTARHRPGAAGRARPRLLHRTRFDLALAPADRLILVSAGAGCGKTTLLRQFLSGAAPGILVRLHRYLRDLPALARSFAGAFRTLNPRAGARIEAAALDAPRALAAAVAAEASSFGGDSAPWLALDDVHELGLDGPAADAIRALREEPGTRLIMAGEELPGELFGAGAPEARMIGESDLRFDTAELTELLRLDGRAPGTAEVGRVAAMTDGWAAAAAVFRALRTGFADWKGPATQTSLAWEPADLLGVLLGEFCEQLGDAVTEGLEAAALLPATTPRQLAVLLADDTVARDAGERLTWLASHAVLAERDLDGGIRLHRLLREYLLRRLARRPVERATALRGEAAAVLLRSEDPTCAIAVLASGGSLPQALNLLPEVSERLLREGRPLALEDLLSSLPTAARQSPVYLWARAAAHVARARLEQARALAEEALALPAAGEPALRTGLLKLLAQIAHEQGRYPEERALLEAALAPLGPQHAPERAELLTLLGAALLHLEDAEAAERRFREALATAEIAGDEKRRLHALAHVGLADLRRGNLSAAANALEEAIRDGQRSGDHRRLAFAWNNLGWVRYLAGALDAAAWACAAAGLHARASGAAYVQATSTRNLADVNLARGDLPAAEAGYSTALAAFERLGSAVGRQWTLDGMARLALCGGDHEAAVALAREALAAGAASGEEDEQLRFRVTLAFAEGLGGSESARLELEALTRRLEAADRRVYRAYARCHLLALAAARGAATPRSARSAAAAEASAVGAPSLAALPWLWREAEPAGGRARLHLRLLGRLELRSGVRLHPRGGWRRPQAALILAYLSLRQGAIASSDSLLDAFWPDVDPEQARGSLHTAIWYLRKVVGEGVLETLQGGYRLAGDAPLSVDVAVFQRELGSAQSAGEERLQHLSRALEHYRGHLLEEYPDLSWAEIDRASLAARHRAAALDAARILRQQGDLGRALEVLRAARALSPLEEDLVQALMSTLAEAGLPDEALAEFEALRTALNRAADLPPLPETRALAETLGRGRQPGARLS